MNINDIKKALAASAAKANVTPVNTLTSNATKASPVTQKKAANASNLAVKTAESAGKSSPSKKAQRKSTKKNNVVKLGESIEAIIAANLKVGRDFSTIPNCGRKPVLLKAGAEKLAEIYSFRTTSDVIHRIEDYQHLFVLYEIETRVYDKDGNEIATGLGSCNSKERKYQRTDFATNLNTVLKMAKKRSYVDAILSATHSSGVFTQDIEDLQNDIKILNENRKEA